MLAKSVEHLLEIMIFRSRWVLAPAYVVLVGCLLALSLDTIIEFIQFMLIIINAISESRAGGIFNETRVVLQALTIVDLTLILNLILMVIFVGYVNFVSKIHPDKVEDWPDWISHIDYSGLKLKLMGSIVAIASIKMLRVFVDVSDDGKIDDSKLKWMAIFYFTFLFGSLVVAVINRLEPSEKKSEKRMGININYLT